MEQVKVLDHGYIGLVESWGSEEGIIEAARMSTAKGFLGWGGGICSDCDGLGRKKLDWTDRALSDCAKCKNTGKTIGDEKLLKFLWDMKHHTPFEMAGLTIEVQAPIFVFREWHRHRVPFSYNEMSARYTPLPDVNYIPTIERLMIGSDGKNKQAGTTKDAEMLTETNARRFQEELEDSYKCAQLLYERALRQGVPKELARVHLPVGRYSRMCASANLRGWLAFLALRSDKNPGAQWEIRQFANALGQIVQTTFPRTHALFVGS
jgi:thymidylate synthase (FAD)